MSDLRLKRIASKQRRHRRTRYRIRRRVRGTAVRPRLAVHKSRKYIYAQLIDDTRGHTLAQASSLEPAVQAGLEGGAATKEAARRVGSALAERGKSQGLQEVVFDRGGYIFHGRIKELADGAREAGLRF